MLYDIAFFIFSFFYLPTLIFKGKLHGDFKERFGVFGEAKREKLAHLKDTIWIQAVSVGEVALLKGFVKSLRERHPENDIVISTITRTGNDLAKRLYGDIAAIIYFPLDFSFCVERTASLIRPKAYVMVETELWPNVLKRLSKKSVPSVLINGRISDRSFGKYKIVKRFLAGMLKSVKIFCMQSRLDAERVIALGAPKERVRGTGNMKFDAQAGIDAGRAEAARRELGIGLSDELLVAGSTHSGEEEAIIEIYRELIKERPHLYLLLAPRHIERSPEIAILTRRLGFEPVRLSAVGNGPVAKDQKRIYILDTIGQLTDLYQAASVVFIGGSLIRHGGQNPIEPAALGRCVIFGPHMFNFKDSVKLLLETGAAIQVRDADDLLVKLKVLLDDRTARVALGEKARMVITGNGGATARSMEALEEVLG